MLFKHLNKTTLAQCTYLLRNPTATHKSGLVQVAYRRLPTKLLQAFSISILSLLSLYNNSKLKFCSIGVHTDLQFDI